MIDLRSLVAACVLVVAGASGAHAEPARCITGGNGVVACGYDCKVGGDGVAVCAHTERGVCGIGGNGKVGCFDPRRSHHDDHDRDNDDVTGTRAACRVGGDGTVVCGFACTVGGDGKAVCADTDDGVCTVGGNGKTVCTELGHLRARVRREGTPQCVVGGNGVVACGYACKVGGNGIAVCASDCRPAQQYAGGKPIVTTTNATEFAVAPSLSAL